MKAWAEHFQALDEKEMDKVSAGFGVNFPGTYNAKCQDCANFNFTGSYYDAFEGANDHRSQTGHQDYLVVKISD